MLITSLLKGKTLKCQIFDLSFTSTDVPEQKQKQMFKKDIIVRLLKLLDTEPEIKFSRAKVILIVNKYNDVFRKLILSMWVLMGRYFSASYSNSTRLHGEIKPIDRD